MEDAKKTNALREESTIEKMEKVERIKYYLTDAQAYTVPIIVNRSDGAADQATIRAEETTI